MRIAEVSSTFPPYRGGIGNVCLENAMELSRRNYDVTVFTPSYENFWQRLRGQKKSERQGFSVKRLVPIFRYGNAGFLPQLVKYLKSYDVIHLHYPFFGGAEVIYFWYEAKKFYCRLRKKRCLLPCLIITYHMDVVGNGPLGLFFRWHTKYLMPKIIKEADRIIVSSFDYIRESNIKKLFINYQYKFLEIPNGVDIQRFQPREKSQELLKKYSLGSNDKIILFVGGLDKAHYFKGIDYLLRTIKILQNFSIKLLIVGEGDMKKEYIETAENLGIKNQVIFTGFISDEDLPKYYNLADLFVLPSIDKSEAFGVVLIEAMASGKPVIASNLAGIRSVVDENKNGFLIDPKNEGHLAERIKYIFDSPFLLMSFGQAGRKKAEEEYSWEIIGNKLDKLIKVLR